MNFRGAAVVVCRLAFFIFETGLSKALGIFIPDAIGRLKITNAQTGLIFSAYLGSMYLAAPIGKVLLDRIRPRALTSICGLLAGLFFIGSAFALHCHSPLLLLTCFVCSGSCSSVIYIRSTVLLRLHYNDNFSFVALITWLGIPAGAAFFTPLAERLCAAYGSTGALAVLGAFVLHMFPIGMTMIEPKKTPRKAGARDSLDDKSSNLNDKRHDENEIDDCLSSSEHDFIANGIEEISTSQGEAPNINEITLLDDNQGKPENTSFAATNDNIDSDSDGVQDCKLPYGKSKRESLQKSNDKSASYSFHSRFLKSAVKWLMDGYSYMVSEPFYMILFLPSVFLLDTIAEGWGLFMVLYAVSKGHSFEMSALCAPSSAAGGMFGVLTLLLVTNFYPTSSPNLYLTALFLGSLCFFAQTLYSAFPFLIFITFLIGVAVYGASSLCTPVIPYFVSETNFSAGVAGYCLITGISFSMSGYAAGTVLDITGNMDTVYYFFSSAYLLAAFLIAIFVWYNRNTLSAAPGELN